MRNTVLAAIAVVGLVILVGLGWLAFGRVDVNQADFEREYTPVAATPAAPVAAPVAPVAQQPALIMPETAAAPAVEAAPAEGAPTTLVMPEEPAPAAPAATDSADVIPLPSEDAVQVIQPAASEAPSE